MHQREYRFHFLCHLTALQYLGTSFTCCQNLSSASVRHLGNNALLLWKVGKRKIYRLIFAHGQEELNGAATAHLSLLFSITPAIPAGSFPPAAR